jgi:CDP-glucose 4,6-dehydratase
MNPASWQGRRVFVTGHTGFKGSWLSLWLQRMGAHVTGYALAPDPVSLFNLAGVSQGMDSHIGDVRDLPALTAAMSAARPDVVLHLAAQALVRESYATPIETFAANVMGTAHVLEAVRATPSVRSVVVVTTDKCYENREWVWGYRETDALGGHDPYSASKACAELVTAAWRNSFFATSGSTMHPVVIATARAGNVIGGGDFSKDRLLPDFVRAAQSDHALEIRHPSAVRPWQFVLEPLAGYLELADRAFNADASVAQAWNFGPDASGARPVREVIESFAQHCAPHAPSQVIYGTPSPTLHETTLLQLDTSKARAHLQWRPVLEFNGTMAMTGAWYRGWLEGADMRALTLQQLDNYLTAVTE